MTERLYYNDSHLTEFDARIVNTSTHDEKHLAVKLDRTAFYPTGGGQPHDTGRLNDVRVVDCVNESDEDETNVLHIVESVNNSDDANALEVGAKVKGQIDWLRRLDHLQQHTAQHIFSQAFVKLFNAETRGFRMFETVAEIDVALDSPSQEKINDAVKLANTVVWENRPVSVIYATTDEAKTLHLRKESRREGVLRLVEIEGFDLTPCGGTHAHATGEVGIILVRGWERAKGMTRLEFLAGNRALTDYNRANETARRIAALFSVERNEAANSVARLRDENKTFARRTRELSEQLTYHEALELLALTLPTENTTRVVVRLFQNRDVDSLNQLARALAKHSMTIALLATQDGDEGDNTRPFNVRFVFARSNDVNIDMNTLIREACAMIGGRGGGRPDFAQGGGQADARRLRVIWESLAIRFA